MNSPKLRAAALGGLLMGVLSAAPVLAVGNVCCCLWLICGGLLASWALQQRQSSPLTPADGLVVGLMAGVIGAVVYLFLAVPLAAVTGPWMEGWIERAMEGAGDEAIRDTFARYRGTPARLIGVIIGFFFQLFFGVVFSSVGGLLGAMLFKQEQNAAMPPPLPPPSEDPPPLA